MTDPNPIDGVDNENDNEKIEQALAKEEMYKSPEFKEIMEGLNHVLKQTHECANEIGVSAVSFLFRDDLVDENTPKQEDGTPKNVIDTFGVNFANLEQMQTVSRMFGELKNMVDEMIVRHPDFGRVTPDDSDSTPS